jgi:hypothetical protein
VGERLFIPRSRRRWRKGKQPELALHSAIVRLVLDRVDWQRLVRVLRRRFRLYQTGLPAAMRASAN